jgi:hypothetical protein
LAIENLEGEIWKDIEGYEGLYEISNMGRVKALPKWGGCIFKKERLLKTHDNGKQYLYVDLYNDGKRKKDYIHRLVAKAFVDNPNNYPHINHIDENKSNNTYSNLEWCTPKYNCNYGNHNIKLSMSLKGKCAGKDSPSAISVICTTTGMVFDTITEAAKYYNIENLRSHISTWCNGNKKFNYLGKLPDGTKLKWMYYKDYLNQQNNQAV